MNDESNSLLSRIESQNKILELTEKELNKKRQLLDTIKNSEDYTNLKRSYF